MPSRLQLKRAGKYKCHSRRLSTDRFAQLQRNYDGYVWQRGQKKEAIKLRAVAKEKTRLESIGYFDRDARFEHHKTECAESVIRNGRAVRRGCIKIFEGRYCEFCISSKEHLLRYSIASSSAVKTLLEHKTRGHHINTLNKRPRVSKMAVIEKQIKSKRIESAEEHLQCLKQ